MFNLWIVAITGSFLASCGGLKAGGVKNIDRRAAPINGGILPGPGPAPAPGAPG